MCQKLRKKRDVLDDKTSTCKEYDFQVDVNHKSQVIICDDDDPTFGICNDSSFEERGILFSDDNSDSEELKIEFSPLMGLSPLPPSPGFFHPKPAAVETSIELSSDSEGCVIEPLIIESSSSESFSEMSSIQLSFIKPSVIDASLESLDVQFSTDKVSDTELSVNESSIETSAHQSCDLNSSVMKSSHIESALVKSSLEYSYVEESIGKSSTFIRAPTLSPLPPSPTSMSSSRSSPVPDSPKELTLCLSPPSSIKNEESSDPLEVLTTQSSSWKDLPSTALLSPLSLSPSLSPLSPLQQPASDHSLSPLPLTPAVSPLSPLQQHPSSEVHCEAKKESAFKVSNGENSHITKSNISSSSILSSDLSVAQRELCADMQCPLPLPPWLVSSITMVQGMKKHSLQRHRGKKGKKKRVCNGGSITQPIFKEQQQTTQSCKFVVKLVIGIL